MIYPAIPTPPDKLEYMELYHRMEEGGWTAWAVFPATLTDEEITDYCEDKLGWDLGSASSYPGGQFHRQAIIKRVHRRVLITQYGGLDV